MTSLPEQTTKRKRRVDWYWNLKKGFGFIRQDGSGVDQFAHESNLIEAEELSVEDRVSFHIGFDPKRKEKAVQVRVL